MSSPPIAENSERLPERRWAQPLFQGTTECHHRGIDLDIAVGDQSGSTAFSRLNEKLVRESGQAGGCDKSRKAVEVDRFTRAAAAQDPVRVLCCTCPWAPLTSLLVLLRYREHYCGEEAQKRGSNVIAQRTLGTQSTLLKRFHDTNGDPTSLLMSGIRLKGQIRRFNRSAIPLVRGNSCPTYECGKDGHAAASHCQDRMAGLIPQRVGGSPDKDKDRSRLKANVVSITR